MSAKLVINQEQNGLELYFLEKPPESVLSTLKNASWRYHRTKRCWYAKQNTANREIAENITGTDASKAAPSAKSEAFFPAYECVGGTRIYQSSDLSCWEIDDGYFQDIQAYVEVRPQRIKIRDLREAMIPGGECETLVLEQSESYSSLCLHSGLDTFRAVYEKYFVRRELPACDIHTYMSKSSQGFSPFKQIAPIKSPKKWTLPHVWKAILSGQIYQGKCDGRYTDDYAWDAAVGFREGVELHLPSFAQMLIEESSGWRVYPDKVDGAQVQLSVNCHTFEMNTLYFDECCDWVENQRRRSQREAEKLQQHHEMESRLLCYDDVDRLTSDGLLFDVDVIEMNCNTNLYEVRHELMMRKNLLYDGRLNRDVLKVVPHPLVNHDLFEIEAQSNLVGDERIIHTCDDAVISGKALREMLEDPLLSLKIKCVRVHRQTLAQLRENLEDWRDGRIQNLMNPIPRGRFIEALARLDKEEARLNESK